MKRGRINGAGIASEICRIALERLGWKVECSFGKPSAGVPAIEVPRDFFVFLRAFLPDADPRGILLRPLLPGLVRWGRAAPWKRRSTSSFTVDSASLLAFLARQGQRSESTDAGPWTGHQWLFDARPPLANPMEAFGTQCALHVGAAQSEGIGSVLEADGDGWTHALAAPDGDHILVTAFSRQTSCENTLDERLATTEVVRTLVGERASAIIRHDTMPRLNEQPATNRRLAIGGGLLRLDPLSASGTEVSAKMALLAAAVADGVACGQAPAPLFRHYRLRSRKIYRHHLDRLRMLYGRLGCDLVPLESLARQECLDEREPEDLRFVLGTARRPREGYGESSGVANRAERAN